MPVHLQRARLLSWGLNLYKADLPMWHDADAVWPSIGRSHPFFAKTAAAPDFFYELLLYDFFSHGCHSIDYKTTKNSYTREKAIILYIRIGVIY